MSAKKINPTRWQCQCEKCKKEWTSRTEDKPGMCPFCKTTHWERAGKLGGRPKKVEEKK